MTLPNVAHPYHRRKLFLGIALTDHKDGPFLRAEEHEMTVTEHQVSWPLLSQAEFDALVSDFDASKGGAVAISFTPPDTLVAVDVRFKESSLPSRKVSGTTWSVGPVVLVEEPNSG